MGTRRPALARTREAAGFTQESLAEALQVDRTTVQRWEQAGTKPGAHIRPKLSKLLHITLTELNELLTIGRSAAETAPAVTVGQEPRRVDGGDDVERKAFLRMLGGSVAGLVFTDPLREFVAIAAEPSTRRVGRAEVEQIRVMARFFARQDHGLTGGLTSDAVVSQLKATARFLHDGYANDGVRHELFSAVAELADVAGGMCFDDGEPHQAERCFRFSVGCATEGGDWAMRAKGLSGLTNLAVHQNRPDDALSMAEMALVRADRLTPVTRSVVHSRHARALGLTGPAREQECLAAVGLAEDYFVADGPAEPVWMNYYTSARLDRDIGRALVGVAVNGGNHRRSQERLISAAAQFEVGSRGHSLTTANLAHVTMACADPGEAVALGHGVLDTLGSIRSDRVGEALRQLRDASAPHVHRPDVRDLVHRVSTTMNGR
ncbi:helix-turn-helix domain-containing protein [Actinokineospora sp. G85]|uniref:helix-turn-helix domain-containing protein n=1 Tax=Actinokineospora sp. G85 TaxID=3406626 RepID=UPI003C770095